MTHMSASEAFVETLASHGVTDVFGIVGSAYMDALDIFEPAGIRFYSWPTSRPRPTWPTVTAGSADATEFASPRTGPGSQIS